MFDMNETNRQFRKSSYLVDFDPDHAPGTGPAAADRIANAIEYMAFQLGQINHKLDDIIEAMRSKT